MQQECGYVTANGTDDKKNSGSVAGGSNFIKKGVSGPGKGPRRLISQIASE
jgi:hypothetical protein